MKIRFDLKKESGAFSPKQHQKIMAEDPHLFFFKKKKKEERKNGVLGIKKNAE